MAALLEETIRSNYDRLPVGERKIADLLLQMRGELAAYSATELAERAGVSKATASRLVRRLGFSDYQQLRQQVRGDGTNGSPLAEFAGALAKKDTLARHLDHDIACLTASLEGIPADQMRRAADMLAKTPRLWVIGFRNSYALALYARELLVQVKPDVRLLPVPGQTVAEELSALVDTDTVLALGFRRQPPEFAKILRVVRQIKARIVLLGDSSIKDIDKQADITLRCQCRGSGLFDTYVAPVSLLNYLCSAVALALGKTAQTRLRRSEQLHHQFGDFGPPRKAERTL